MTEKSYPVLDGVSPLTGDQWKTMGLTWGYGIIDHGGLPYYLIDKNNVDNTVTIRPSTKDSRAQAIIAGFVHHMDAPVVLDIPPVASNTTYEIGLMYDPLQEDSLTGPISLRAWTTPADLTGGKIPMVLWRGTRTPSTTLSNTTFEEIRPRASFTFNVYDAAHRPPADMFLVGTEVRILNTDETYRAMPVNGTMTWVQASSGADTSLLETATGTDTPHTLVKRGADANFLVPSTPTHAQHPTAKTYVDGKVSALSSVVDTKVTANHNHSAAGITNGELDNDRVKGSTKAYSNTNVGSTWASVVATSSGNFGRYPSALKYKKGVRNWALDPETVYGLTPVKYEDKQSSTTRVGFVADSYVANLPELVEFGDNGDVEGWSYMLTCVAQQVAIRDLNERVKALEAMLTAPDENGGV